MYKGSLLGFSYGWQITFTNSKWMSRESVVFKDTVTAFDDYKNKQQKCMKKCFLTCKSIFLFLKFIQYHIH